MKHVCGICPISFDSAIARDQHRLDIHPNKSDETENMCQFMQLYEDTCMPIRCVQCGVLYHGNTCK